MATHVSVRVRGATMEQTLHVSRRVTELQRVRKRLFEWVRRLLTDSVWQFIGTAFAKVLRVVTSPSEHSNQRTGRWGDPTVSRERR